MDEQMDDNDGYQDKRAHIIALFLLIDNVLPFC